MKGPTAKTGSCGEIYTFRGSCIFELPRLDFLLFQHDFRSFSDKMVFYWGESKPSGEGGGGGGGHRG